MDPYRKQLIRLYLIGPIRFWAQYTKCSMESASKSPNEQSGPLQNALCPLVGCLLVNPWIIPAWSERTHVNIKITW